MFTPTDIPDEAWNLGADVAQVFKVPPVAR